MGTSVGVISDVGVICIHGRRLRLWIPNKDKLSIACDMVVITRISLKDRIRSTVGMSCLKKVESSVHCDKAMEKRSTMDDNGVRCDKVTEKGSTIDDNGIRCDEVIEKRSIVDDDGVGCDKAREKNLIVDNDVRCDEAMEKEQQLTTTA